MIAKLQTEALERNTNNQINHLKLAIREISHDIKLLAGLPLLREIGDLYETAPQSPILDQDLSHLREIFRETLEAMPNYSQIRLIGKKDSGKEIIRLDRTGTSIEEIQESDLRQKGHRDYFLDTPRKISTEPYFSKIDLNREDNLIEVPHRPTLRVSLPVFDSSDQFFGIVIININFRPFFEKLFEKILDRYQIFLTDDQGNYLIQPDSTRTFGFDLEEDYRAQNDFPELGDFFDSPRTQITFRLDAFSTATGDLIHFQKFQPFENSRTLALGSAAYFDDIAQTSASINLQVISLVALLIAIASLFAFLISTKLVRPIQRISRASKELKKGKVQLELPTDRDDEIGDLARAFSDMRESITRNEDDLIAANNKLSEANKDLKHFSHISSHELREPLHRIASIINLLKFEETPAAQKELLRDAENECVRAIQQIADFRAFSRIGEDTLLRETVDMEAMVKKILENFTSELDRRNIKIRMDPLPSYSAYPNLIYVLYRNLVENALKYSKGERIVLYFTAETTETETIFGLKNTGSSIPPEKRDSIFDLFTRLDKNRPGTGTGLTICKRIVERHSGRIWAESTENSTHIRYTLEETNHENTESDQ